MLIVVGATLLGCLTVSVVAARAHKVIDGAMGYRALVSDVLSWETSLDREEGDLRRMNVTDIPDWVLSGALKTSHARERTLDGVVSNLEKQAPRVVRRHRRLLNEMRPRMAECRRRLISNRELFRDELERRER